ncbi:MAG: hydroxymethylbilane synthase [Cytophagales bacterium]|nr:hydroxymethylbilane synthase [Cytophagales bacterium]
MRKVKIGTRNSALAIWQANYIGSYLEKAGLSYELIAISTKGDQILDRSLSKIGSKGVFTEELEQMLRNGDIDIAQHSAKDLPSTLPEDLQLIAFTEREKSHDVLLSLDPNFTLNTPGAYQIGTSSTRRRAFLGHLYPNLKPVEMRGNLQTRLEKLKNGDCDAMILAYAGVYRMDMSAYISEHLPLDQFIPAVGQGSVAIQCAKTLSTDLQNTIRSACNHEATEICILAERELLSKLDGGCSVPVYGHAHIEKDVVNLTGGVLSLDGQQKIEFSLVGKNPIELGQKLADQLIGAGASELLKEIRRQISQ